MRNTECGWGNVYKPEAPYHQIRLVGEATRVNMPLDWPLTLGRGPPTSMACLIANHLPRLRADEAQGAGKNTLRASEASEESESRPGRAGTPQLLSAGSKVPGLLTGILNSPPAYEGAWHAHAVKTWVVT